MNSAQWMALALAVGLAIAGILDLYMAFKYGEKATISYVVRDVTQHYPIVALLLGILLGHLIWPQFPSKVLTDTLEIGGLPNAGNSPADSRSLPMP